jgi:hypothetical protein
VKRLGRSSRIHPKPPCSSTGRGVIASDSAVAVSAPLFHVGVGQFHHQPQRTPHAVYLGGRSSIPRCPGGRPVSLSAGGGGRADQCIEPGCRNDGLDRQCCQPLAEQRNSPMELTQGSFSGTFRVGGLPGIVGLVDGRACSGDHLPGKIHPNERQIQTLYAEATIAPTSASRQRVEVTDGPCG